MPDQSHDTLKRKPVGQAIRAKVMSGDAGGNGVYENVKARVLAHEWPCGRRISVEPLADQLFVSNTPVREALIRLAAERVIKDVPKAGFFTKELSESEIRDLYTLQQLLLDWCLSVIRNDGRVPGILKPPNLLDDIDRTEEISPDKAVEMLHELFVHIARQSGNSDVIYMVGNINDRTHYVREKDHEMIGDPEHKLFGLCQNYYQRDFHQLRKDLAVYFRDKMDGLRDLLRLLV